MTLWRPPRTRTEQAMRAIRSMQNGSMDGRIVSAYPAKPDIEDEEYEEYSELEDEDTTDGGTGGGGDASTIKPWTDYFTVSTVSSAHNFNLTKTPWAQPKMSSATRDYASVHLYWNGILQRDMAYSLEGSVISILDVERAIRPSDTITVKYFFNTDAGESDDSMYRMLCWFHTHNTRDSTVPGYSVIWNGIIDAPPVGGNSGQIKVSATRYYNMQEGGSWEHRFKLPPGQKIPVGDDVAGVNWRINYDPGADTTIKVNSTNTFFRKGSDYGDILFHKSNCGLGGGDFDLPLLKNSVPQGPFNPTFGPIGGILFASGAEGKQFARTMNTIMSEDVNSTRGVDVGRGVPRYDGGTPYNAGCTYAGGIANAEDTLYGRYSYEAAVYDLKIGVTASVVWK